MTARQRLAALTLTALAAAALSGCDTTSNNADLKGVEYRKPDKIEGYQNVDGQPNVTRLCIDGVAFLTNSREQDSVLRVPEWDAWCKGPAR